MPPTVMTPRFTPCSGLAVVLVGVELEPSLLVDVSEPAGAPELGCPPELAFSPELVFPPELAFPPALVLPTALVIPPDAVLPLDATPLLATGAAAVPPL